MVADHQVAASPHPSRPARHDDRTAGPAVDAAGTDHRDIARNRQGTAERGVLGQVVPCGQGHPSPTLSVAVEAVHRAHPGVRPGSTDPQLVTVEAEGGPELVAAGAVERPEHSVRHPRARFRVEAERDHGSDSTRSTRRADKADRSPHRQRGSEAVAFAEIRTGLEPCNRPRHPGHGVHGESIDLGRRVAARRGGDQRGAPIERQSRTEPLPGALHGQDLGCEHPVGTAPGEHVNHAGALVGSRGGNEDQAPVDGHRRPEARIFAEPVSRKAGDFRPLASLAPPEDHRRAAPTVPSRGADDGHGAVCVQRAAEPVGRRINGRDGQSGRVGPAVA